MITPLIKRNKDGELYERLPAVTTALERLSRSPRDELLQRAAIRDRNDPDYVSGECLVHHIRASRMDNSVAWFELLHKILMERIVVHAWGAHPYVRDPDRCGIDRPTAAPTAMRGEPAVGTADTRRWA